ncbi:MAG: 50S ribosomal protein L24 [Lachnospiraceae bacterium]|nr:50S ribosomal protein L24 [Lachnospiraceae bacterium]
MSAVKIKKGDLVKVIAGKDKGKEGKVVSVDPKNHSAVVEGINMVTKHAKPSAANQQGGIIHQESSIDISNIQLMYKGKATKVGYKFVEGKNGQEKVRVAKATGEVIE